MDGRMTLILLLSGLGATSCSQFPLREYYYVSSEMSWAEARLHCRRHYSDLATFESAEDVSRLSRPPWLHGWSWIGLEDKPESWQGTLGNASNSWKWSADGRTIRSEYQNWNELQPNNINSNQPCVKMDGNGSWTDIRCCKSFAFVCYYTEGSHTRYVFVSAKKTWLGAQAYCRKHYTDLAIIRNAEENHEVYSAKPAGEACWIGLYREPWAWSDKTQRSYRHRGFKPDNFEGKQHCVAEGRRHKWDDIECYAKLPFICQKVSKSKIRIRVTLATSADLADLAVNDRVLQQLGEVLKSRGWPDVKLLWTQAGKRQKAPTP